MTPRSRGRPRRCALPPTGSAAETRSQARSRLRDGRTALYVYSAIDRLQEQYGDDAPWVLLAATDLQAAYEQVPYDLLFVDRPLHPAGGATP